MFVELWNSTPFQEFHDLLSSTRKFGRPWSDSVQGYTERGCVCKNGRIRLWFFSGALVDNDYKFGEFIASNCPYL